MRKKRNQAMDLEDNSDDEAYIKGNERQVTGKELEAFLASNPQVKQLIESKAKEYVNLPTEFVDTTGRLGISTLSSIKHLDEDEEDDLFKAASKGDVEKCELLLETNININVCDEDGQTALHWACDSNEIQVVHFLVRRGADVNIKDNCLQTPLHFALINGHEEVAKCLLQAGANIDAIDEDGNTPGVLCDNTDILKRLGINIETISKH